MTMREIALLFVFVVMVFYCSAWAVTILYDDENVNFRRAMLIVLKRVGVALMLTLVAFEGYLIDVAVSLSSNLKPYTVGHKRADQKRKQEAELLKKQRNGAL